MKPIVDVMERRLREFIDEAFEDMFMDDRPDTIELNRHGRDSARWAIRCAAEPLLEQMLSFGQSEIRLSRLDGSCKLNCEERDFAQALDRADFVEWWHRNADRKPYAVKLVRGGHQNYFYPDFVVCPSHAPGDAPSLRLVAPVRGDSSGVRGAAWLWNTAQGQASSIS